MMMMRKKMYIGRVLLKVSFFLDMWRCLRWRLIRFLCGRLFLKYSTQPVSEVWCDPVATFKETRVYGWARFVVYVVWLKQFPLAQDYYCIIERQFPRQIPSFLELLSHWIE